MYNPFRFCSSSLLASWSQRKTKIRRVVGTEGAKMLEMQETIVIDDYNKWIGGVDCGEIRDSI
jgi:hypothetical protein